ncbi:MAG: tRNA (adenosine(37)-N6)-dimethylallyltransferase MiaA [Candidatus Eremiobacteraeota bacterium]|nr:tRNA (adenosine(37)-N6)-dimethylallyltransferase MiaA [Candidatus Eremiobacteraeota bacterium]
MPLKAPGVLIISGPTASGKTALAVRLAHTFDAEIVGADSRHIYSGMPIGTAAPTVVEQNTVPQHLIGFLDPHERYSAARFSEDATAAIQQIHARGKRAIVVGGTGFYIRVLTGAVDLAPQFDPVLRDRLAREVRIHDGEFLFEWLEALDPLRAAKLYRKDTYRVVRALEVVLAPEHAVRRAGAIKSLLSAGIPFFKSFLDIDQVALERRIAARTDRMLRGGLLEEAELIGNEAVAASAVGYPQANAFLRGWLTHEELRMLLLRATRRYAKRQFTWFRSEPQTLWVESADAYERLTKEAREKLGWA